MDNCCFLVSIRQRICQSGVPLNINRTYTNIPNNSTVDLLNGYRLTIYRISNNMIRLTFANTLFELNFSFDVNDATTNVFDLPIDSGTFRIAVFAAMRCCCFCN